MKRSLLFFCLALTALAGAVTASAVAANVSTHQRSNVQTFLGATPTPTPCASYSCAVTPGATIVPGATDTGNHCDDCVTNLAMPFPFLLYGVAYNAMNVSSNGNAQFVSTNVEFNNSCLPVVTMGPTIFAYWEDLVTVGTNCTGGCGIYTSVSGTAPNRIFNIEWRTFYFSNPGYAYFEIRLYETGGRFDVILGAINTEGTATIGVQDGGGIFTQCVCNTAPTPNSRIAFTATTGSCPTPSSTPTPGSSTTVVATATYTRTPVGTATITRTSTFTATPLFTVTTTPSATLTVTGQPSATPTSTIAVSVTNTPTPGAETVTPTPCTVTFSDVGPSDFFYTSVLYLACRNIISGYGDGTFRPYSNTTRGQMCKIIVLAEGWTLTCPATAHFSDVSPSNPFYCHIETAYAHSVINGYSDGTFRPYNNVTRGQTCKIVVLAEGWQLVCPPTPHFNDVPMNDPFYCYVETAYAHGVISGYSDGTFRSGNDVTRGQLCKVVYTAVTQP